MNLNYGANELGGLLFQCSVMFAASRLHLAAQVERTMRSAVTTILIACVAHNHGKKLVAGRTNSARDSTECTEDPIDKLT